MTNTLKMVHIKKKGEKKGKTEPKIERSFYLPALLFPANVPPAANDIQERVRERLGFAWWLGGKESASQYRR